MNTPDIVCPSCHRANAAPTILRPRGLDVRQCSGCSMVFLGTRPDTFEADLYAYYGSRIGLPREQVYRDINRPRLGEILRRLDRSSSGRSLLDVGCGAGQWVDFASEHGWTALGIDLSREAIALATSLGAPADCIDFFDDSFDGRQFSAITMWELIEHVPEPGMFVERAASLLRDDGVLVMSTPNFGSLDRRRLGEEWHPFHPEHLLYFSPATFRALLERSFEHVQIETRGMSLARRGASREQQKTHMQDLRAGISSSPAKRLAKRVFDRTLRHVPLGSTLVAWASGPRRV